MTAALVALVVVAVAIGWGAVALVRGHDGTGSSAGTPASAPPPSPTGPMPSYQPDLARFYQQKLQWHACAGGDQCAALTVPLDYAHPDGRTIRLAILRVPARDRAHRIGQLVVDPGGPGVPATQYAAAGAAAFGPTLARYFDLVGMDPRGVGQSTPIRCLDTQQQDEFLNTDPSPDTPAEVAQVDASIRRLGDACLAHDRGLTEHMSTVEAAKDMDVLRAALGEPKLDYHGASYGTLLGATYADLFPDHVGKMVLDGAIDPALSNEQFALGQARGFQTALDAYVDYCIGASSCPIGNDKQAALDRISTLLRQVDQHPMPTGGDRPLTEALATAGIAYPLYARQLWPSLTDALRQAVQQGNGSGLLTLADTYNDRGPRGFQDNSTNALYAVNCLDHDDFVPSSQVPRYLPAFEKAAPTFAKWFAYGLSSCSTWPVQSGKHTTALHAKGAPPIVVIGTTRDPATPYPWAQGLARELDSGHLITRNGDGHTGFAVGNQCVDDAVDNYYVRGLVPRAGLTC
ncbi:MAG: alpha/beta fold hydrolase [Marmoricola sp.]|nr:alpha/beta fold hydrolase [Marmoricola sp.]